MERNKNKSDNVAFIKGKNAFSGDKTPQSFDEALINLSEAIASESCK